MSIRNSKGASSYRRGNILKRFDVTGNGKVGIEDIIIMALRTPGIVIDREEFLRRRLRKSFPAEIVDKAIETSPYHAGIPKTDIDKFADKVINYESSLVSGISAALSTPNVMFLPATIPADILQYYSYILRTTQKLLYLYGFPQIKVKEKDGRFDEETMNILIICLGVMNDVAESNNALNNLAKTIEVSVEKRVINKTLTSEDMYPVIKRVVRYFGVRITKRTLNRTVASAMPLIGGVIGGSMTYSSFKKCCYKLKKSLGETHLCNSKECFI